MRGGSAAGARSAGPGLRREGWVDASASWAAARVAVLGAYALSGFLRLPHRQGLLNWDAFYYRFIAEHGYPVNSPDVTRFFPLVPMLARGVALLPGVSAGAALLAVANGGALAYGLLLYRLARYEGMDDDGARRAVWLLALAPPAFVLVMGYTESVWGALTVAFVWALRRRAWLPAAAAGVLAGACRPAAVVLVAVAAVEALRAPRSARRGEVLRRVLAVLSPAAGTGAYLAYIGARTGSPLLPYTVQAQARFRGAVLGNPLSVTYHAAADALRGLSAGAGAHVVWLVAYVVLLVVVARRLPASYTVLAALSLVLAATSGALSSLERYAWSAFPFTLALASLTGRPWLFRLALTACTAGIVCYALLAFARQYVP